MYISLSGGLVVRESDLIAVCDMDNSTFGRDTRSFLKTAEARGEVFANFEDIPRSFVLCKGVKGQRVYLVSPSARTLEKRSERFFLSDNS